MPPLRAGTLTVGLLAAGALAAADPLPACRPGRFVVAGRPLLRGGGVTVDALVLAPGPAVAIASGCEATAADVRAGRAGTRIRATWASCGGGRRVRLDVRSAGPTCGALRGRLAAGGRVRRFRAVRVRCAPGENVMRCGRFLDIAHRGGANLRPENTLVAFAHAVEAGADVLEMDVHATADGVVVVLHDATVDRTTDGTGPVAGKTFAEVQALDAGHRFTPDGVAFPYRGQGLRVPALAEVLAAFADRTFSIEIKQTNPSIVDAVLAVVEAAGALDRVVLVSFGQDTVEELRRKAPAVLTGMSLGETLRFAKLPADEAATYVPPAPVVQIPYAWLDAAVMARAERLGVIVQAWTANDRPTMDDLLGLGIHGIMSDDPEMLRTAIDATGADSGVGP